MRELILATSYWLHLIATVIWIGGIIFILFIAIPSSRQVLGAESGKLTGEISNRGLVLTPKIVKTESITEKASLQKLSLNLVKVNFCAGLVVLLLSGVASIL